MRPYARLHAGRIVALALRVWLRRGLQIHAVAALCLAPLVLVLLGGVDDPVKDGQFVGLFGLYSAAWVIVFDFLAPHEGFLRNVTVFYLAQFAVTVLVARDAYGHLSGRVPRCGPRAVLALVLLALGGLALFVALHAIPAVATYRGGSPALLLGVAITLADLYVAGACWLAMPAAAAQGHGLFSALARARMLSDGSRFSLAAIVAWLVVLQWLTLVPLVLLADRFLGPLIFLPAILCITIKACMLGAAYHEACFRKEGAGTEDVSAVFA